MPYAGRMDIAKALATSIVPTPMDNSIELGGLRNGVLSISIMEMLACLLGTAVYIYAAVLEPSWAPSLVPEIVGSSVNIVQGCMYVIGLLCLMGFFQAICLFKGAINESRGLARFWLYSMLSSVISVSLFVLGMLLGGVSSPPTSFFACMNIVLRFMEFPVVYTWIEDVTSNRLGSAVSTNTIPTIMGDDNDVDAPTTPPPTRSSSETATTVTLCDLDEILPVPDDVEFSRKNLWRQQQA